MLTASTLIVKHYHDTILRSLTMKYQKFRNELEISTETIPTLSHITFRFPNLPHLGAHMTPLPRAIFNLIISLALPAANVGDSTRLGRARGTFSSEFQREQLSREEQQHRAEHKEETMKKEGTESSENVTEIATITGSCLAVIVLLSTVGSLGFIMYRYI